MTDINSYFKKQLDANPLLKVNLLPLLPYINEQVTDIGIDRPGELVLDYADGRYEVIDNDQLDATWMQKMALTMASVTGQLFDKRHPIVGFKLPGGHRCQVMSGYAVEGGFAIAIRVNRQQYFSISDFGLSTADQESVTRAIRCGHTLLISGGTGAGKTSFLNAVLPYIPKTERLLTIEDVPELVLDPANHPKRTQLFFSNSNRHEYNQTAKDLLDAGMRMNPSRIIMGEIRHQGALTFANAINSGHPGSLATIHANNPKMAIQKLHTYIKEHDKIDKDTAELCRNISAVIQLTRKAGQGVTAYVESCEPSPVHNIVSKEAA